MDLPRVVDDVFARLDALAQEQAEAIAALPRPRALLERKDGRLWVRARLDAPLPSGWRVVCRFRRSEDSPPSEYDGPVVHTGAADRAAFARWPRQVAGRRIWYQLGVQGVDGPILYEPWASLPVDG
jgi:hypothetical protein